jgi:predicted amidohydrolase
MSVRPAWPARTTAEVAAIQLDARPGKVEDNLARFADAVRGLGDGVDLVVAPELLASGYDLKEIGARGKELAETLEGPTVAVARELAANGGVTIIVGLLERDGDTLYDSLAVVGPRGELARYRKTHLYPPERRHFGAGDRLMTAPTPIGRVGLMICFEHAFPDIATTLALRGATVLAIPSAVPRGYEHLLDLRTRARAQDNQVFAVAANLTGEVFCGRSLIAGPRGEVLAAAGVEETAIRATIDLRASEHERRREPALRLRRPELYRQDGRE